MCFIFPIRTLALSATTEWTFTERWRAEIVASWAERENRGVTPPVPPGMLNCQPGFTTDSRYRRGEVVWIDRLALGARSDLAFGVDFVAEQGSDNSTLDLGFTVLPDDYRLERTTASGYFEWGQQWAPDVTSSLAVRLGPIRQRTSRLRQAGRRVGYPRE